MRSTLQVVALIALLVAAFVVMSDEQKATSPQMGETATQAVEQAEAQGVVVGQRFAFTPLRAQAALQLVETKAGGASCQISCSGGKVAGIVCAVGEMCQCSCMGGGPDCTCRNSN